MGGQSADMEKRRLKEKPQFEACTRSQGGEWSRGEASEQSLSQGAAKCNLGDFVGGRICA